MFNNLSDRELATVFEFYLSYGGDKPIVDIEPGQTEFIHGLKKSILDGDDWSMLDKEG